MLKALALQLKEVSKSEQTLKSQLSESESKISTLQERIEKKEISSEVEPRVVVEQATQRSANNASIVEDLLFEKQKLEDDVTSLK